MKITTDLSPTVEVEFESVSGPPVPWVRLPNLTSVDELELRRPYLHAMRELFAANGPARMAIGGRVLKPLEAEMRRRSLEADYWTMEHWRRSNAAFDAKLN